MTDLSSDRSAPEPDIDAILTNPTSKLFNDFRDRAAYVLVTGIFPTHLRSTFTQALSLVVTASATPTSLDGLSGVLGVNDDAASRLRLDEHPMVRKARALVAEGYRIRASRGPNSRRSFTKVFMHKGQSRLTVQVDGSFLDGWPD